MRQPVCSANICFRHVAAYFVLKSAVQALLLRGAKMKKKILRKAFMNITADALGKIGITAIDGAEKLICAVSNKECNIYIEENAVRKKNFKDVFMLKTAKIIGRMGRTVFRLSDKINMNALYRFSPDEYDEFDDDPVRVMRIFFRNDEQVPFDVSEIESSVLLKHSAKIENEIKDEQYPGL